MSNNRGRYTTSKYEIAGITIYDCNKKFRRDFMKHHLKNTVDLVRFSYAMGRLAVKPVIGKVFQKALAWHYHYIHTNSTIVPIEVAEELIKSTADIAVSPCVCRVVQNKCDNPLNTCFGINFYGEVKKKAGERSVTQEECLAVARLANERRLIAAIESCIQPYQNNLCFCCPCCCMPLNLKTTYGVPFVDYHGPYLPHFDESACDKCRACERTCPVGALTVDETGHHIDLDKCLGCGICRDACPNKLGTMVLHEERRLGSKEPGRIRVFFSILYVYAVLGPAVFFYKLFNGSQQGKLKTTPPRDCDILR